MELNETGKHIIVMPMTVLLSILSGNNLESISIEIFEISIEISKIKLP